MTQRYKIFVRNIPLILTDNLESEPVIAAQKMRPSESIVLNWDRSSTSIEDVLQLMERSRDIEAAVIYSERIESLRKALFQFFHYLEAAGGLVINENDEVLVIYRRGRWDLPKGKVSEGETMEKAAQREVQEETGITGLNISKQLIDTYHTYHRDRTHYLKRTVWFAMRGRSNANLSPQTEEDIERVEWRHMDTLEEVFDNTYESIKEVFKSYFGASLSKGLN